MMVGGGGQEGELVTQPLAHAAIGNHESQDAAVEVDLLADVADVDAAMRKQRMDG